MVRFETLPFVDFVRATAGQLTWVWLNMECDYNERRRKIHSGCLPEWERVNCEVCGKPVGDDSMVPEELRDEIYRPGEDEVFNIERDYTTNSGF